MKTIFIKNNFMQYILIMFYPPLIPPRSSPLNLIFTFILSLSKEPTEQNT